MLMSYSLDMKCNGAIDTQTNWILLLPMFPTNNKNKVFKSKTYYNKQYLTYR